LLQPNKDTKLIRSPYFLPPMLVLQQSKRAVSFTNRPKLPLWRSSLLLTKPPRYIRKLLDFGVTLVTSLNLRVNQQQLPPPPRPSLWRKRNKRSLLPLTKPNSKLILSNNSLSSSRFKSNLLPT